MIWVYSNLFGPTQNGLGLHSSYFGLTKNGSGLLYAVWNHTKMIWIYSSLFSHTKNDLGMHSVWRNPKRFESTRFCFGPTQKGLGLLSL